LFDISDLFDWLYSKHKKLKEKVDTHSSDLASMSNQLAAFIAGGGNILAGNIQSETFTATAGQTEFTLTDTEGSLFMVVVENVPQTVGEGYTRTSDILATLSSGATIGDTVTLYYFKASGVVSGSKWYYGEGVPSDETGDNGDYYLNLTNGDVYTMAADTWGSSIGNIKGATGEGGSAHIIQEEGTPLTARANLNFVGAGVTVTDDEGNNASVVTIHSSSGLYGTVVGTATYNGNKSVTISAVDVETEVFTAVAHGLLNNDRAWLTLNSDASNVYLPNIIPGGLAVHTKYYVVNKTDDTFQLSATAGGAAIDITTNANLDLAKFHIEALAGDTNSITVSGLTAKRKYRCMVRGKINFTGAGYAALNTNNCDTFQSVWSGSGQTSAYGSCLFLDTAQGSNGFHTEALFDMTDANFGVVRFESVMSKYNSTTQNANASKTTRAMSRSYGGSDITSISLTSSSNAALMNGTRIDVYEA